MAEPDSGGRCARWQRGMRLLISALIASRALAADNPRRTLGLTRGHLATSPAVLHSLIPRCTHCSPWPSVAQLPLRPLSPPPYCPHAVEQGQGCCSCRSTTALSLLAEAGQLHSRSSSSSNSNSSSSRVGSFAPGEEASDARHVAEVDGSLRRGADGRSSVAGGGRCSWLDCHLSPALLCLRASALRCAHGGWTCLLYTSPSPRD